VVIDHRDGTLEGDLAPLVVRLCDRRRGVGADGVLLIERDPEHDFAMRYFNADGRAAEFCGNGARCVARVALDLGLGRGGEVRFRTDAGVQSARRAGDGAGIELRFGILEPPSERFEIEAGGRTFEARQARAGVPHLVIFSERVEWIPLAEWGSALRHHPRFAPHGTNVDFVSRLGASRLAMRTYERGVEAETLACGSGAMCSALCAKVDGERSPIAVVTAGGDELQVTLEPAGTGWFASLTGPVEVAFEGRWREKHPVAT
jgi:diaminopimelate epimerase